MEIFPFETVAEMLRRKRQKLGINQKKAADLAGLSPSQVNRIENDSVNPSYESVYELYEALELLEDEESQTAEDMMHERVCWIESDESLEQAAKKMRENDFSQLPVRNDGENVGRITETMIIEAGNPDLEVGEVMREKLMAVNKDSNAKVVEEILKQEPAVLVEGADGFKGIVAKADLL